VLFTIVVAAAVLLSGCSSFMQNSGGVHTIKIAGSTSMLPVSETLARYYENQHPGININVQGSDSTVGMRGMINGIVDIAALSRSLTANEQKELNAYEVALDQLTVITNPENPVERLDFTDLRDIFSGKITSWKQLGGNDYPISVLVREEGSGTALVFGETVMGEQNLCTNAAVLPSTGAVKAMVAKDKYAIGYISSNYLSKEIKPIIIKRGKIESHILTRHLVFVTEKRVEPSVRDFLTFVSSGEAKNILAELKPGN
jgi:phosphate transport system substrate-binding protein